jgi:chromosome segregation ATPase
MPTRKGGARKKATASNQDEPRNAEEARAAKYPTLHKMSKKLEGDREALLKKSAPLRERRDALDEQIQPLLAEQRDLNKKIHAIERPKLGEIDNELAGLARAMGARSLANPEPAAEAE